MKALIFGCGYLGRRVADRWIAAGHEVTALTRSPAKGDALRKAGIIPIVGDITNASSLASLPSADVVLYAVGYDRSSGDRRTVVVEGLCNAIQGLRGKSDCVVFISTTSVYGQTDGEWIDETSLAHPVSDSGAVALEAESVIRAAGFASTVILRLSGLYGPDRLLRRVEQMQSGEPLSGSGDAWLNLIHVEDAATAAIRAAGQMQTHFRPSSQGEGPGLTGERTSLQCYLVSDDRPVRRREYYEHLAALTGSPRPIFDETASSRIAGLGKRCRNDAAKLPTEPVARLSYVRRGTRRRLAWAR